MKISPRYDADPAIHLIGEADSIREPLLRQRRRLAASLASLTTSQWHTASRCEGWRVQDVIAHLTSTDQFWAYSIRAGLSGQPSKVLASFDPQATPAEIAAAARDASPEEALASYLDASGALCASVASIEGGQWAAIGESPVGHVTMSALAHHALWDSWVHERDIVEPLGLAAVEEPDEVAACLRYAIALSPAFTLQEPGGPNGAVAIETTAPDLRITATVHGRVTVTDGPPPAGSLVLHGDAVELLEALSVRRPLPCEVPDEHAWLVSGLSTVFEPEP